MRWHTAAVMLCALACANAADAAATHPLDPLDADELVVIKDVLANSARFSSDANFAWIQLEEPSKSVVEGFNGGTDFPRKATVAVVDYQKKQTFGVTVDVKAGRIVSSTELGGLQPVLTDRDIVIARGVVNSDPRVRQALVARGLSISRKVSEAVPLQYLSIGHDETLHDARGRFMRVLFGSDQKAVNTGSPPLDGLMLVIDLNSRRIVSFYDHPGVPKSDVPHDVFDPKIMGGPIAVNPVLPAQTGDKNFTIAGKVVTWQNWRFRFGFNQREGLVLYQLAFNDNGRWRPIVYRASVSEVVTAYGDPSDLWSWMEIFDEGGSGLGSVAAAVRAGREVPANAATLGVLLPDPAEPSYGAELADRIYVYERDGGNLLHYQQGSRVVHARATELVIGFVASLGNYDYALDWVFKQDGSFRFEVELAGEVLTKFVGTKACQACKPARSGPGVASGSDDRYGTLVYPGVVAVNHQHWFNLRLNFEVDGNRNAVAENNVRRVNKSGQSGGGNAGPYFTVTHSVLARAVDAKRDTQDDTSRTWTIYNPSSVNRAGHPAGYTIVPGENATTVFPKTREREPIGFTFHHFWATPLRDGQLYAGGLYPDQAKKNYTDTLYYYANQDSIYDRDVVVWYSLGETHAPRPEDYPLMSSAKLSVGFVPDGFFDRNPALGLGVSTDK